MSQRGFELALGGAAFDVLPGRALYWKARGILVVADVHVGKAAMFRAHGVPVPHGTTAANLARLSRLVEATGAATLVFLGDLLHAREALAPRVIDALARWRAQYADVAMVLVEGNHDRKAGTLPAALEIECVGEPFRLDNIAFRHHPQPERDAVVLAGHMHPVVHLRGRADESARLPCFWLRDGLVILPAFGDFTGGAAVTREPGDRVIAIAEDRLFEIPPVHPA